MTVHEGHRRRMIERYQELGLEGFASHEVLEVLMYFSKPRVDTNETAHNLMDVYGTLADVFDASRDELTAVPGVGDKTAMLLNMVPRLARRYIEEKGAYPIINSTEEAGKYFLRKFSGCRKQSLYIICLDAKNEVLAVKNYDSELSAITQNDIMDFIELSMNSGASAVIFGQNRKEHPKTFSKYDAETALQIKHKLNAVGIELVDYIIVSGSEYVSLKSRGVF